MRLDRRPRLAVYAIVAILLVTGAVWLLADRLKEGEGGELWQQVAANMLMVHGGAAMAMLLLLGALLPLHVGRAWRAARNRATGSSMAALNGALVATAFGLYYAGADAVGPWMSAIHTVCGFVLPLQLVVHVALGRPRCATPPDPARLQVDGRLRRSD